jgi:hypothetical protein
MDIDQEKVNQLPLEQKLKFEAVLKDYKNIVNLLQEAVSNKDTAKIIQLQEKVREFKNKYPLGN